MLRDSILDEILSRVAWESSVSTYQMVIDALKKGEISDEEFKVFLKDVCLEWGKMVESHYKLIDYDDNPYYD